MTRAMLVVAVLLAACQPRTAGPRGARVVVLGIDGMDPALAAEMMRAGELPALARLASRGGFAPLGTSTPPQSPTAWSGFITGLPPGRHGIFDFVHRDPATLTPYLSTSQALPGSRLNLGSLAVPLSSGSVELLRRELPFWRHLDRAGVGATVVKIPAHFPPTDDGGARVLSGMGTPDLLGTYGTYTVLTTDARLARRAPGGGRGVLLAAAAPDRYRAVIEGPPSPFSSRGRPLLLPLGVAVDRRAEGVLVTLGARRLLLGVGEWSAWVPFELPLLGGVSSVSGMVRVYLASVEPLVLYVSPLNIDPERPALPISSPASFARDLARRVGRFDTLGIPEDTKALSSGVLTERGFLLQARQVLDQRVQLLDSLLAELDQGLLFFYFSSVDQLSHVFFGAASGGDRPLRDAYRRLDHVVQRTQERLGPADLLLVMSDHGFGTAHRLFDLNAWLRQAGYLALRARPRQENLGHIDWARTQAYGLGLNGLYLNLAGRERDGAVPSSRREELLARIAEELLAVPDSETGAPVVTEVVRPEQLDPRVAGRAPDLVVGYGRGYRVSDGSALGEVGAPPLQANTQRWRADHCGDHRLTPGVLFASRRLGRGPHTIYDLAPTILAAFGVHPPPDWPGRSVFSGER